MIYMQVKHYRALQEQASTYLDLVCSVCDLSHDAVRAAAAEVQQIKLLVSVKRLDFILCNIQDMLRQPHF